MRPALHPLTHINRRINWLNAGVNLLGASVTFFYLSVIDPPPVGGDALQALNTNILLTFTISMAGLMLLGGRLSKRFVGPVDVWCKRVIAGAPVSDIPTDMHRILIEYPLRSTATTFYMWIIAAVLFAMLSFGGGLRTFIGIVGVGGILVAAIYYFACDLLWQPAIAILFPAGQLRPIGGCESQYCGVRRSCSS